MLQMLAWVLFDSILCRWLQGCQTYLPQLQHFCWSLQTHIDTVDVELDGTPVEEALRFLVACFFFLLYKCDYFTVYDTLCPS